MKRSESRRQLLKFGGAMLFLCAGGAVYRGIEQGVFAIGTGPAYEPWRNWRGARTAGERIVAAALLAANPHNSQPWTFRLSAGAIDLYADPTRQIGAIDPLRREMYIGLGCALENMTLAAAAEGFAVTATLMPDASDVTHAARLSLIAAAPGAPELYAAIPRRATNRAAYDVTRAIAPAVFDAIDALVTEPEVRLLWFRDEAARTRFGAVAVGSAEALTADEQQSIDSSRWWRHDWSLLQAQADGITLDAQGMSGVVVALAKLMPDLPRHRADAIFVRNVREIMVPTAAAFGILAVRDRASLAQRLRCGQAWQRIHLWGTTRGLAMQPLNQMCERVDRELQLGIGPVFGQAVAALIDAGGWQGIMPFRLGYPTQQAIHSPRRNLHEVIR